MLGGRKEVESEKLVDAYWRSLPRSVTNYSMSHLLSFRTGSNNSSEDSTPPVEEASSSWMRPKASVPKPKRPPPMRQNREQGEIIVLPLPVFLRLLLTRPILGRFRGMRRTFNARRVLK